MDTVVTSHTEDGTAISRAHPSRAKGLMGQGKPVPSVILRFWVLVRPRESNTQPPALLSTALPTELILLRSLLYRVGLYLATGLLCFSAAQNDRLFFLLEFVQLFQQESLSFTFSILAYSRKTLHELNKIFVENVLLVAGIPQPRSNSYAVWYSHVWKTKFHESKQDCVQYKSASKSLVFKNLVG